MDKALEKLSLNDAVQYLAVDVECAATGKGHNDRAPCSIAAVDKRGRTVFFRTVKVDEEVLFSPMTKITGLTREEIAEGVPLDDALAELRANHLGERVVLVGQSIYHDVAWLGLEEGVDFKETVNIEESFKSWNRKYDDWNYFSLRHEAYGLLGIVMNQDSHDPAEDARVAMKLFTRFIKGGRDTSAASRKLREMRYKNKFPASTNKGSHVIDGVCGAAFNPKKCICGQPTKK